MNKISLIIAREFLSRVRRKSFYIASILGPILIGALIILPTYFAMQGGDHKMIIILDESGYLKEAFISDDEVTFEYVKMSVDAAKKDLLNRALDGLVYIPQFEIEDPKGFTFYSGANPSLSMVSNIERKIDSKVEDLRLSASGLDKEIVESFKVNISVNTINLSQSGDETKSSSGAASAIGYVAAFMIYMFVFIYGAMCMRGVIEEKNSRIVEIIVSSVRPFQLMMGKVIGIAAVGLAQFLMWIVLTFVIVTAISSIMGIDQPPANQMVNMPEGQQIETNIMDQAFQSLEAINFPMVIVAFLFYFVGGYLLYGALFAAVGSASDSDADAQQFMLPVTIPLIASIAMLGAVLNDPGGSLSFWLSMIPFTSPVTMMMRVPFGVEVWELALSMSLLVLGFIFTIWVAGRIYRVGILMHGAKVNWKILAKWFMTNN